MINQHKQQQSITLRSYCVGMEQVQDIICRKIWKSKKAIRIKNTEHFEFYLCVTCLILDFPADIPKFYHRQSGLPFFVIDMVTQVITGRKISWSKYLLLKLLCLQGKESNKFI